jgi:hypothetical protein
MRLNELLKRMSGKGTIEKKKPVSRAISSLSTVSDVEAMMSVIIEESSPVTNICTHISCTDSDELEGSVQA